MDEIKHAVIKETLAAITKSLKDQKRHCEYSGCLVQYFEHWHIDEHTLTFRKPEPENGNS